MSTVSRLCPEPWASKKRTGPRQNQQEMVQGEVKTRENRVILYVGGCAHGSTSSRRTRELREVWCAMPPR